MNESSKESNSSKHPRSDFHSWEQVLLSFIFSFPPNILAGGYSQKKFGELKLGGVLSHHLLQHCSGNKFLEISSLFPQSFTSVFITILVPNLSVDEEY